MPVLERDRHFLSIADWPTERLIGTLELALRLKRERGSRDRLLAGKSLAMVFAKSSTRTRVSFEVGMYELGGEALFLSSRDIQIGRGEPIADTARALSRYVHGIMIRTFAQEDVEELATYSTIPVINGLTDLLHPCQVMADLMTAMEEFGPDLSRLRVAWIGDGNNMANSWLNAAALLGFELRLACPEGFEPDRAIFEQASSATQVSITEDPDEAVEGAHVISTDVWASMGQEAEADARTLAFKGYTVDADLMAQAADDAIFLHCLPAHRGEEVTNEVIEGPQSRVFQQAENRLHVQKGLMVELMAGGE
jgi:ornithine carbamoyltransferase